MDQQQKSKYNMVVKELEFLGEQDTVYATSVPMNAAVAKTTTDKETWDGLIAAEAHETTGITGNKDIAKKAMADEWAMICSSASGYALVINDHNLEADWNHTAAEIAKLGDAEAAALCEHLSTSVNDELANLASYSITTAILTAADDLTVAFKKLLGKAKAEEGIKSAAGQQIDLLIKEKIDPDFELMDALVNGIYFKDKRDFKLAYFANRKQDDLPTHHTELEATVYIAGTTTGIAEIGRASCRERV